MLQGQIRGKIMGKRCNRSSRSVIGPDATIDIHQLVVPIEICMIQTYPETVTNFNLMQLKERIVNGPDVLFGAKVVDALNGQKIDLAMIDEKKRKQIQLRPGMVVHRHLQKGDLVGFNRQPSLHKESMMGHEIIPMPGKTFRFHLAGKFIYNFLCLYILLRLLSPIYQDTFLSGMGYHRLRPMVSARTLPFSYSDYHPCFSGSRSIALNNLYPVFAMDDVR